jgi:hypothetical protein
LLNADYTQLSAWLYGGESRKYVNEGVPFRVSSEFYDTFGELASYKVEAFVSTDSSGTAELTGLEKSFTLTPTIETFYDVDYLTGGVISQGSDYDYMRVMVTVYDSDLVAKEMQTQYVQFHNYPFFENDVILTAVQRTRLQNRSPAGTVTMQITEPDTLNAIKVFVCEGRSFNVGTCLDNAEVIEEFVKDVDFTCNNNVCQFDFELNSYVFDGGDTYYTTYAIADLKTCDISTCGGSDYLYGMDVTALIQSALYSNISYEVPAANMKTPAGEGTTVYGVLGNWCGGVTIPTDYRLKYRALLYAANGDFDFSKYVTAKMTIRDSGTSAKESPEFLPIKTEYLFGNRVAVYYFDNIIYNNAGSFFTDLSTHKIRITFEDESLKLFAVDNTINHEITFDDSAEISDNDAPKVYEIVGFKELNATSFVLSTFLRDVNQADEMKVIFWNENSTHDDQKNDRQNQRNTFTIPTYQLIDFPKDYNASISQLHEKQEYYTANRFTFCLSELFTATEENILEVPGAVVFGLTSCWGQDFSRRAQYRAYDLMDAGMDETIVTGFVSNVQLIVNNLRPYDYNYFVTTYGEDYPDVDANEVNSKIDEIGLSTGQGDIILKVGDEEYVQRNNLVMDRKTTAITNDTNATFNDAVFNVTIQLYYDNFSDSTEFTTQINISDLTSFSQENDCFSLLHLERGDTLSCLLNAGVLWTLQNLAIAFFIIILFFSAGWFIYQVK